MPLLNYGSSLHGPIEATRNNEKMRLIFYDKIPEEADYAFTNGKTIWYYGTDQKKKQKWPKNGPKYQYL